MRNSLLLVSRASGVVLILASIMANADVFRCRLDNGELLYTDLGCLNSDIEQRYKDMTTRLKRKQFEWPAAKTQSKSTPSPASTPAPSPDAATIESNIIASGFINYDHYERSLDNCQTLQADSDQWLNNRCDQALAIAKVEQSQNTRGTLTVDVTSRGAVDLSDYRHLDTRRSSTVRGVWYHENNNHLVVKVNAAYYAYCDVNRPIVMQLVLAPSISGYLHSHIKGLYDC